MLIYKAFYALFRCTSVPSRGGVRSGESAKMAAASTTCKGILYPFYTTHLKAF